MSQKTLVYPFDRHFLPIIRNSAYPTELLFSHFVSPNGWGYEGMDAGSLDESEPLGVLIESDFERTLTDSDIVLFTQSDHDINKELLILPKIVRAIETGKRVLCTVLLTQEEVQQYSEQCLKYGNSFEYLNNNLDYKEKPSLNDSELELKAQGLYTPVIMIFGLIENIGKFDTQLALTSHLKQLGYDVALVASRSYGKLFGAYSVPPFFFDRLFTEFEKIVMFNNYIRDIENNHKPDIFVIGVPGGLVPINKNVTNRYGVTAYEMTREVIPDASILCTHFERYTPEYIENLKLLSKYRFSTEFDGYIVDNVSLDVSSRDTPGHASYTVLPPDTLWELNFEDIQAMIRVKQNRQHVFDHILSKLSKYSDLQAV
jgi:peptide maturation system protein (TIGR04066 family)